MSHYKYQPLSGRFISTAFVDLSFEEMRWEYYEEMKASEGSRKRLKASKNQCMKGQILILSDNEDIFENKKIRHLTELNGFDIDNKRGFESDFESDELPKVKRRKVENPGLSIDDKVDVLSKSIRESCKKLPKEKNLRQKNVAKEEERLINLIIELRKVGNEMVKLGEYSLAYDKYTDALNVSSKYAQLNALNYSNRAFSLMKLGRYKEALGDCDAAIANNSRESKSKLRRIKCLFELERFDEAKISIVHLKSESGVGACDDLLAAIITKEQFASLVTQAKDAETSGNLTSAYSLYTQAEKIDGKSSELFKNRARVLFALARYRESLNDLNEALKLDPVNNEPLYNRVGCLLRLERFQEAIHDAEALNRQLPSGLHARLLRDCLASEKLASKRNYYEILGVDRTASMEEIKKCYRKLCLLYHPDKMAGSNEESRAQQAEKFKNLTHIFNTISCPVGRKMYDRELSGRF